MNIDTDGIEKNNKTIMLTTIDNPYNPFTNFNDWKAFDEAKGYYTCSLLARFIKSTDELSETNEQIIIEDAINRILKLNLSGKHKKISN